MQVFAEREAVVMSYVVQGKGREDSRGEKAKEEGVAVR